jgi:Conserved TM helix
MEGATVEPANTIGNWGAAILTSVTSALSIFVAALPRIIGFFVILLAGWYIASLIARGVAALLRKVHFNELSQRAGLSNFVERMGVRADSAGFLAGIVKWFVRLGALVIAFDALGLPAISQVLHDFLLWLPNLIVAMVVLVIGGLAANALASLVRGSVATARIGNAQTLSRVAAIAVWAFAIVVAVNQLGIATGLINTLFMAAVGSVAIAVGLAFGLGGRDTAGQIVRNWYLRSKQAPSTAREALTAADTLGREERTHEDRVREDRLREDRTH